MHSAQQCFKLDFATSLPFFWKIYFSGICTEIIFHLISARLSNRKDVTKSKSNRDFQSASIYRKIDFFASPRLLSESITERERKRGEEKKTIRAPQKKVCAGLRYCELFDSYSFVMNADCRKQFDNS